MIRWKRSWSDARENLPVDVLPCCNEEYLPAPPTKEQIAIMQLADRETERLRRKWGLDRRTFVRTAAATGIGFWAIDAVHQGKWGNYALAHNTKSTDACDLEYGGQATLKNLPGEFIFDVQSHHVDPEGAWRVINPAIHAFFAAVWPQSSPLLGDQPSLNDDGTIRGGGAGELDPIENLSRHHYMKELYLDSATTMTVLSCVPSSPDTKNPLPLAEAALTVKTANHLAGTQRACMHAFVMPNRGGAGLTQDQAWTQAGAPGNSPWPLFHQEELDLMMERAAAYPDILRGWKTYCAWGDVPNASGWVLDSDVGMSFIEQVIAVHQKYPQIPPTIATHKGFALPGFDQRGAAARDVGPAAKAYPGANFVVYHSGYDSGDTQGPYRGDATADSSSNTVDGFIKSLRENNYDATKFIPEGKSFGNVPNVWAELGSVWRDNMDNPDRAAHLLGKLITYVGPKRIAWGTDSLWYGSPQPEIVALRTLQFSNKAKEFYNLPYGLDGDVEDPTQPAPSPERTIRNGIFGRNVAEAYNIDPDAARAAIDCDAVNEMQDGYIDHHGTELEAAPMASNHRLGPRTRRDAIKAIYSGEWTP